MEAVEQKATSVTRVRFGPFELDIEQHRLRKHRTPILLRDQALEILITLVDRAGELVTREDLRRRLWADRAFGEFESGLNTAMSRLRQALGESAHTPRFIETVPKRGYRFISPIERTRSSSAKVISDEGRDRAPVQSPASVAYTRGHYLIKRHTAANAARALEYFLEAIRLDPAYALPYHGAALVSMLAAVTGDVPAPPALQEAERFLSQGLALDANSAMLQNTLAMLRMWQRRWHESEQAYRAAIAADCANPHPRMMYALLCSFLGHHEQALAEARTALALDPVDPMMNFRLLQCLYYARRYDEAIQCARTGIELSPEFPYTYGYYAFSLVAMSLLKDAWTVANKARALAGGQAIVEGQFAYVAACTGHADEAFDTVKTLRARRKSGYCAATPIAWAYLALGNDELCFKWLDAAVCEGDVYLASLLAFPGYDKLRGDERFAGLLSRVGLGPVANG